MGQIANALGQGTEITIKDQAYKLSPWTYEIQGQFERYLESEAVKAARRMRPLLPEEDYRELLSAVNRDIAAGVYTFGSDVVARAIQTSAQHFTYLLWLMLRPGHPEVKLDLVKEYVKEKIEEAMEAVSRANTDPTSPPGATPEAPADNPPAP